MGATHPAFLQVAYYRKREHRIEQIIASLSFLCKLHNLWLAGGSEDTSQPIVTGIADTDADAGAGLACHPTSPHESRQSPTNRVHHALADVDTHFSATLVVP